MMALLRMTGAALLALVAIEPLAAQEGGPPQLEQFVEQARAAFEVPGIAVAIVKDGQTVVAQGFGTKELGSEDPVDDRTRFGIASNTKAFTATALGLLVEDGKLEWDAPVISYLPWFQMWDPWVTREISVRDLLVHRSGLGLGQGDLLGWPPSDYSREEIVRRVRYLEPVTSFRSAYAYDNILYHVAALVIEAVSGGTWEDFIRSRIIEPLGMSDTRVTRASTTEGGNVARTHARVDGTVQRVRPFDASNTNAAGGINSTASDIARWLKVQLDSGRVAAGERLFSPATTRQLWTAVTPMPLGDPPPELASLWPSFRGYGLGFVVQDYRGHKMITHTGGLPGYVSRIAMIPELRLGVAVFTNQEAGGAFNAITYQILDHYLGLEPTDWIAAFKTVADRGAARMAAMDSAVAARRADDSRPSLPLSGYAGRYTDDWYGDVVITQEGDGLVVRFQHTPLLVGDLEFWQYDTFIARWRARELRADAYLQFVLTPQGEVAEVRMSAVSPTVDFSYDFHDLHLKPAE